MTTATERPAIDYPTALRSWASGSRGCEAAVELLIRHGFWIESAEFRECAVRVLDPGGQPLAVIEWSHASAALDGADLRCTTAQAGVLAMACGLAANLPTRLLSAVCGLDTTDSALVAAAIVHAATGDRSWWPLSPDPLRS
jgi:hypothetical protein